MEHPSLTWLRDPHPLLLKVRLEGRRLVEEAAAARIETVGSRPAAWGQPRKPSQAPGLNDCDSFYVICEDLIFEKPRIGGRPFQSHLS